MELQRESKTTLADILVNDGVITTDQLKKCQDEQDKSEVPFEQAALTLGLVTRESIANSLGNYYDVPYMDLDTSNSICDQYFCKFHVNSPPLNSN